MTLAKIAIVGAGQGGLQLAIGLVQSGHEVKLLSNRSAEQIENGSVTSTQFMFGRALGYERELGIDFWEHEAPRCSSASLRVATSDGSVMVHVKAGMDVPGQSIDQRVKIPRWMRHFEELGGDMQVRDADVQALEELGRDNDLVIVAAGKGEISAMFQRDEQHSVHVKPPRFITCVYLKESVDLAQIQMLDLNINPGVGEVGTFPGISRGGPCRLFTMEAVPGGPMDCWQDVKTPADHLAMFKQLITTHFPLIAHRIGATSELIDDGAALRGHFVPVVRNPVGRLPSGRAVMGMGDVLVLNDPVTGQGSNNASKCAKVYLDAINRQGGRGLDEQWMEATFAEYWNEARWVTEFTNMALNPPGHMLQIMKVGESNQRIAKRLVDGFNDPTTMRPWFYDPMAAADFLEREQKLATAA
jgi:hypothetical protein